MPARASLPLQVAAILREDIRRGAWSSSLPSIRELSVRFQVSRPTVQAALVILEKERLVELRERCRTRIVGRPRSAPAPSRVVFMAPWPYPRIFTAMPYLIANIHSHLQKIGHEVELRNDHYLGAAPDFPLLAMQTKRTPAVAWILYLMPEAVHRWFQDRNIPAVILGTREQGLRLPAVDVDYRSSARHAAGLFLSRGHRHIGLLCPRLMHGGDHAATTGFEEAFRLSRRKATGSVFRYEESKGGLITLLKRIMLTPDRPTALLIDKPMDVVTTVTWLYAHGMRIPGDLSLIAHDDLEFIDRIVPTIARYTIDWPIFVDRMVKQLLRVVRHKKTSGPQMFVEPEFVSGLSVGAPPVRPA